MGKKKRLTRKREKLKKNVKLKKKPKRKKKLWPKWLWPLKVVWPTVNERDVVPNVIAERRKPLNIDHMDLDKLREKCQGLWDYLKTLETERYDFEKKATDQKYEVNLLRFRSNMLAGQSSKDKAKRIGRLTKK